MSGNDLPSNCGGVAVSVVEAVADATESDPLTMDPPLYDAVDPDALARVVRSDARTCVAFEYDGHSVVVDGDGTVTVDDRVTRAWATTPATDAAVDARTDEAWSGQSRPTTEG